MSETMPPEFINHMRPRVEKYGLNLAITPPELEVMCAGNARCEKALAEMLVYAKRYAEDVWHMKIHQYNQNDQTDEEWAATLAKMDSDRTRLHNTYIDSIAILSRALIDAEQDVEWVRQLMSGTTLNRAACGNFAIMLSYYSSVNSRESEIYGT